MSDMSQGPGWWQATDGKWYPPESLPQAQPEPAVVPPVADAPPAPGWWKASDGNWYPPAEPTPLTPTPAPAGTPPPGAAPPGTPGTVPPGPAPAAASPKKSGKGLLIGVGIFVVLILVIGGAFVVTRGGGNGSTGTGSGGDGGGPGPIASGTDDLPSKDLTLTGDTIVVRGNGGKTVRSVGDDGKTLVLDAGAEGVDKLEPGKILLLTGITVVKVKELNRNGGDVTVTAEPATLPEVIQDGELNWNEVTLNPDEGRLTVLTNNGPPDSNGTDSGGSSDSGNSDPGGDGGDGDITIPEDLEISGPASFTPYPRTGGEGEQAAGAIAGKSIKGKVGPLDATITYEGASNLGHHLNLKLLSSAEVTGTFEVDVELHRLANSGKAKVSGGTVQEFETKYSDFGGTAVISTDLKGLENVATIQLPPFFKLPFSLEFPAIIGGIPFTLSFSGSVQVTVSMAMGSSSLSGKAEITYDGDAGFSFKGGQATLNGQRSQDSKDPLEFLKGVAPGPVGLVVTTELPKVGFGFGFLQTGAGVYISNGTVVSQTILPPPAQCTASNIAYVLAAGVDAKFLGKEFDIARKAFVKKEWNYQVPQDKRCNAPK